MNRPPQVIHRAGEKPVHGGGDVRRAFVRLVEPESLPGLSLGGVLLGLTETGEGRPDEASLDQAEAEEGPVLRLRIPDGRVEPEPLLGGFWRRDKEGGLPRSGS